VLRRKLALDGAPPTVDPVVPVVPAEPSPAPTGPAAHGWRTAAIVWFVAASLLYLWLYLWIWPPEPGSITLVAPSRTRFWTNAETPPTPAGLPTGSSSATMIVGGVSSATAPPAADASTLSAFPTDLVVDREATIAAATPRAEPMIFKGPRAPADVRVGDRWIAWEASDPTARKCLTVVQITRVGRRMVTSWARCTSMGQIESYEYARLSDCTAATGELPVEPPRSMTFEKNIVGGPSRSGTYPKPRPQIQERPR
jgi:hypothetical protein